MNLFDVYPLLPIELVKGRDCYVYDQNGVKYLDLYGGHAVISIGHCHPHYVKRIRKQLKKIGFYSNSVINSLQLDLAAKLGKLSGYDNYQLFLCNSGAEANENAIKIAAFQNPGKTIIAFERSFHGRTSRTLSVTDNEKYRSPLDDFDNVIFIPWNDIEALQNAFRTQDVCAVIIEGIQGLGGIYVPETNFLKNLHAMTQEYGALLILDEVQSGYGRTGKFFAHQYADIRPDIITVAKGMGNGFPIGGVLISPSIESWHGMSGTTFGGNHLACAAGLAVLEVLESEKLIQRAGDEGNRWIDALLNLPGVKAVRGKGLMIGLEMDFAIRPLREKLFREHHILTGTSVNPNTIRLLPPLTAGKKELDKLITALQSVLNEYKKHESIHPSE
ncbi:aspartate aminotransferase family protein [Fulvivirga sedimenti]|uniref:Aminotransferase class III-fold pyridoxal phosphate-dependent enzyme n=1 Tax=Fulvivirga sedimenti TaxID=2879465 RepID=A0A9X1HRN3_9BACT|nr:aminotransferase class III-fold pyridoxal phosphate-dependent enzyme [Fulvivirga sedimenti]MCA6075244.1 aminotransferase class III-fold pyridoxal phosphate-dependent enzyme [Fulvivirga sedimenti]MCA6076421.1 aminotransferase class III-fold pyridoxal phosphate-dependent enzyme [Fulvivirga sedimenti]MCA6077549.1 aminotransferase class III-fold pyridoxal phosphate-dependent enzyme [Fulvivirga sedimenti]